MKPIFETKLGKLYQGGCLEVMKQFKPNEFSLCLTDPPYGIGESAEKNNTRGSSAGANKWKGSRNTTGASVPATKFDLVEWDNEKIDFEILEYLQVLSKNQIIFGGNYYADHLPPSSCWIVWDKNNGSTDFADCELAWTSFDTAVRIFKYTWNGMLQQDMKNKEKRYHPTQKPIRLFEWIIENYYKDGIIFDPFAGSGTTAVICERLKIPWVCIEREPKYCDIIIKRLSEIQQGLFS